MHNFQLIFRLYIHVEVSVSIVDTADCVLCFTARTRWPTALLGLPPQVSLRAMLACGVSLFFVGLRSSLSVLVFLLA